MTMLRTILVFFAASLTTNNMLVVGAAEYDYVYDDLKLADCPNEPHVTGTYRNNGKKCVRERQIMNRVEQPVGCPEGFTIEKNRKFCRQNGGLRRAPAICPPDYTRRGKSCLGPCRDGYRGSKTNNTSCEMPRDTLGPHYMTCNTGTDSNEHKFGTKCCSSTDICLVECHVSTAPGKFYYKEQVKQCIRDRHVLPRAIQAAVQNESGKLTCPKGKIRVSKLYCQDPCPEGYMTQKGKCKMSKCVLQNGGSQAICPEGTYNILKVQI